VSFSLSSAASFFDWSQFHCLSLHVRLVLSISHLVLRKRRNEVPEKFGNVAKIAAECMEELAGGATLRDAGTTAGIATDKLLALSGELGGGAPVQILLSAGAEALRAKYAHMVREIEALPNPREPVRSTENGAAPSTNDSERPLGLICRDGKNFPKANQCRRALDE
jgi:hypothetical protein